MLQHLLKKRKKTLFYIKLADPACFATHHPTLRFNKSCATTSLKISIKKPVLAYNPRMGCNKKMFGLVT